MIKKGIEVAGQVKNTADTINTASKAAGINQDSIFAKNEAEGKGGAINSVFQAADTITGGAVAKTYETADSASGGVLSQSVQGIDKIATPILEAADSSDIGDLAKKGKKMPDFEA